EVTNVNIPFLKQLMEEDIVPVIAPIALGADGNRYNVNADTAAGAVAEALGAKQLVFVTDVPGILQEDELLESVTEKEVAQLFSTYNRFDLTVAEASRTVVKDTDGKEYLDFGSGIGVCNLGHRHPDVQQAIEEQLNKYWHVSNLYHVPLQEEVAKLLTANSAG